MQKIIPHLWFDHKAEEAVKFYTSIFKNSKIGAVSRYSEEGQEVHGMPPGSIMSMDFEIEGQKFMALNDGPTFKFTEAISFIVNCENQQEIDYYWDRLTEGGDEKAQVCGWLKDKYGVSWQIVPVILEKMMQDENKEKTNSVMREFLKMKKIDISKLKQAYER